MRHKISDKNISNSVPIFVITLLLHEYGYKELKTKKGHFMFQYYDIL